MQDLAQEILLQAWRSLPRFEGKARRVDVVLSRGTAHRDEVARKDKPRRSRQQPLLEVHVLATEGANSAEQAQHRETVEQLYKAIHQLPKTDAALVLLYLDELSYRGDGRSAWHLRKQRGREAESGEKSAGRADERPVT